MPIDLPFILIFNWNDFLPDLEEFLNESVSVVEWYPLLELMPETKQEIFSVSRISQ